MSNVALLDMLANGTNPPKIMPYLGDCYDSLANLTFVPLEDGTTSSKTINEMVSRCRRCSICNWDLATPELHPRFLGTKYFKIALTHSFWR